MLELMGVRLLQLALYLLAAAIVLGAVMTALTR